MIKNSLFFSMLETKFSSPRFNLLKTIWLNFRTLPFKQACKLPILLYGSWNFRSLRGSIVLNTNNFSFGMVRLGLNYVGCVTSGVSTLTLLKGSKIYIDEKVRIAQGVSICLYEDAELRFGYDSHLGDSTKVICAKRISIGKYSGITWECQVMDHGSHYTFDKVERCVGRIIKPIVISDYCWVGNRTTIMPGTKLPPNTIVASNSLLNKDYVRSGLEEYCLIGGQPARLIKKDIMRVYNRDNERDYNQYFRHSLEDACFLSDESFKLEMDFRDSI